MTNRDDRAALVARVAARIRYTPDLFDEACRRAVERVDTLDDATLALLASTKQFTPGQVDLLLKIFPPRAQRPEDSAPGET